MAGFLTEPVDPAMMETPYAGQIELDRMTAASPTLPSRGPLTISSDVQSITAGQIAYLPSVQARDYATPRNEHPAETREFGRLAPMIEIRQGRDNERVPDAVLEPMEFQLSSFPPNPGTRWLGPPREFPPMLVELAGFVRLDFLPDGAPAREGAHPYAEPPSGAAEARQPPAESFVAPLPSQVAEVHPTPVESEAPAEESLVPDMVTQPLPVTLHGIAAGRGRVTPAFASALSADADLQIPPSTALPLRPTMVLGPAPAVPSRKPEPKPEPKIQIKPEPQIEAKLAPKVEPKIEAKKETPKQAEKPERSPIVLKPRKTDAPARIVEPAPSAPEAAPQPTPEIISPPGTARADLPSGLPKPSSLPNTFDLGLPSLEVQAGPWARLSTGVKVGLAVVILAAVAGVGYLVTSGGHSG
ncbi:MAG: hypothetical protein ACRD5L_11155, partial [Bryobacteraceae bacterium]